MFKWARFNLQPCRLTLIIISPASTHAHKHTHATHPLSHTHTPSLSQSPTHSHHTQTAPPMGSAFASIVTSSLVTRARASLAYMTHPLPWALAFPHACIHPSMDESCRRRPVVIRGAAKDWEIIEYGLAFACIRAACSRPPLPHAVRLPSLPPANYLAPIFTPSLCPMWCWGAGCSLLPCRGRIEPLP